MCVVLSPAAYIAMAYVRGPYLAIPAIHAYSPYDPRSCSTNYYKGTLLAKTFTTAYILLGPSLELRCRWHMPGLLGFNTVRFLSRPLSSPVCSHSCTPSDALDNPVMHFAFLFLLVVFMFMLLCTMFCDPGICATKKEDLKPVREAFSIPIPPSPPTLYESHGVYLISHVGNWRPCSGKSLECREVLHKMHG